MQLDTARLSDPNVWLDLPFPCTLPGMSLRFSLRDGNFRFMGRRPFQRLLDEMELLKQVAGRNSALNVYGTSGYGKSHMLAALVVVLMQAGKRVAYIPDCGAYGADPAVTLRRALSLAFVGDERMLVEIEKAGTLDALVEVCQRGDRGQIYFVADQFNALEEEAKTAGLPKLERGVARSSILRAASCHYLIKGLSANNHTARISSGQLNEAILELMGGMDTVGLCHFCVCLC